MRIIIAGSGDTGTHLAKMLAYEHQDVTLMSADRDYLSGIDSSENLLTAIGDPTSPADLRAARVEGAGLFVAVTPYATRNIVACQLAASMGVGQTVARIESPEYTTVAVSQAFGKLGVDSMVYPESLVAEGIIDYIDHPWAVYRRALHQGALLFSGINVTEASPMAGRQLKALGTGRHLHVTALRRQGRIIIPRGDDTLEPGDTAYFTSRLEDEDSIRELAGQPAERLRSVMIAGQGGVVTSLLPSLQERGVNVTVVSDQRDFCRKLAADWPDVAVVCTQLTDLATMREEGMAHCDLFLALGDKASQNIVSSLMAKTLGVKRTVAQIEDLQYICEATGLGIDMVVNKKLITSGMILRSILAKTIHVRSMVALEDLEVAELEVAEGAPVTRHAVKDLSLPLTVTLGGLTRGGRSLIVEGSTRLEPGDVVLVVFQPGMLSKVEKLFRRRSIL